MRRKMRRSKLIGKHNNKLKSRPSLRSLRVMAAGDGFVFITLKHFSTLLFGFDVTLTSFCYFHSDYMLNQIVC